MQAVNLLDLGLGVRFKFKKHLIVITMKLETNEVLNHYQYKRLMVFSISCQESRLESGSALYTFLNPVGAPCCSANDIALLDGRLPQESFGE